jgi:Mg/Co/Ni transporter MgtE
LLEVMPAVTVSSLLSLADPEDAAEALNMLSSGQAAKVVARSGVSMVTEWLSEVPANVLVERAQKLLVEVNHIDLAVLLLRMPARRARYVVSGLPAERVAPAIAELSPGRAAVLLALVTEEHTESILKRLPEAMRKSLEASLA